MIPKRIPREDAIRYGSRGGQRHRQNMQMCVEGEYVGAAEIAARLGVHRDVADKRIAHLRKQPGPITWAALKEHVPRSKP